jgi:hypothetical protein
MTHTPQLYQIIAVATGQPVGGPGTAWEVSDRCTALNDAANPDPERPRDVLYRVERVVPKTDPMPSIAPLRA